MDHALCVRFTRTEADAIIRWRCCTYLGMEEGEVQLNKHLPIDITQYIENRRTLQIFPRGAISSVADAMHKLLE